MSGTNREGMNTMLLSNNKIKGQAALEFLMSYGWVLIIIVIAGGALYSMGILNPSTYMKKGCVGFEKLHYKDHILKRTGEKDGYMLLRIQNGGGAMLQLKQMAVEYPESVYAGWSGEQNVSEAEQAMLIAYNIGQSTLQLNVGAVYRAKVTILFDVFNALTGHTETAICSGKIE